MQIRVRKVIPVKQVKAVELEPTTPARVLLAFDKLHRKRGEVIELQRKGDKLYAVRTEL